MNDLTQTELRILQINWDALRMIMQGDVTMWHDIAAKFESEGMSDRAISRCHAKAEQAERVLETMATLEKSSQA